MHVHAVMFGGSRVTAAKVVMAFNDFMVVLIMVVMIVMIVVMAHIHGDGVDGITSIAVMLMGMGRRGRNEAVACESKRQAEAK